VAYVDIVISCGERQANCEAHGDVI
jgi:hypothetical protein